MSLHPHKPAFSRAGFFLTEILQTVKILLFLTVEKKTVKNGSIR